MKLRDSGMPNETYWESLFDVELILNGFRIDSSVKDVSELGCGYGTFTIPIAKQISGKIETIDIDPHMVERTLERAKENGLKNVIGHVKDVLIDGFPGQSGAKDVCLLFNILHSEEPVKILKEAARVVKLGGSVFVIHWRHDIKTPRGPDLKIRPKPQQIIDWAKETNCLDLNRTVMKLPPWHYGLCFSRIK